MLRIVRRSFWKLRGRGLLGTIAEAYHGARRVLYGYFLRAPGVRSQVRRQVTEALSKMEAKMVPADGDRHLVLPKEGWADDALRAELARLANMDHTRWEDGYVSGAVYHGEDDLLALQTEAYGKFTVANPIHPDVFPGVRKMEAEVVAMVKNGLDVMTLSIGDGANDVAMIQEADVGVGIAGEEGRQAVMSSDYAIGQFRFLQRLVLVHGRWSYRRLAETISNFFYKNMIWTFTIFWYQCYCQFDITYLFEFTLIMFFNLAFTSLPPIVMGIFDQDVSDTVSLAVPQLYRRGIERLEWTQKKFW